MTALTIGTLMNFEQGLGTTPYLRGEAKPSCGNSTRSLDAAFAGFSTPPAVSSRPPLVAKVPAGQPADIKPVWAPYSPELGELLMANFRPLHDRVLIQRVEAEEMTKGGIIIPDSAKEKPVEGKVVAVGNGKILEDGKVRALEVKGGRPHPVRQVQRHGDQDRRRRTHHPPRGRSVGHPRLRR